MLLELKDDYTKGSVKSNLLMMLVLLLQLDSLQFYKNMELKIVARMAIKIMLTMRFLRISEEFPFGRI